METKNNRWLREDMKEGMEDSLNLEWKKQEECTEIKTLLEITDPKNPAITWGALIATPSKEASTQTEPGEWKPEGRMNSIESLDSYSTKDKDVPRETRTTTQPDMTGTPNAPTLTGITTESALTGPSWHEYQQDSSEDSDNPMEELQAWLNDHIG